MFSVFLEVNFQNYKFQKLISSSSVLKIQYSNHKFCYRLRQTTNMTTNIVYSLQLNVPSEDDPTVLISFRKLLLTKCQIEFEKDKIDELDIAKIQQLIDAASTVSCNIVNINWDSAAHHGKVVQC